MGKKVKTYSQIVTLDNLNTVYKKVRKDIAQLGNIYIPKGNIKWSILKAGNFTESSKEVKPDGPIMFPKEGEVYVIIDKGAEEEPKSLQDKDNIICIQNYSADTKIDWNDPSSWKKYWNEVGQVITLATRSKPGVVSTENQEFAGQKYFYPENKLSETEESDAAIVICNPVSNENGITNYHLTSITGDQVKIGFKASKPTGVEPDFNFNPDIFNTVTKTASIEGDLQVYGSATVADSTVPAGTVTASLGTLEVTENTSIKNLYIGTPKTSTSPDAPAIEVQENTLQILGGVVHAGGKKAATNLGTLTSNNTTVQILDASSADKLFCDEDSANISISGSSDLGIVKVTKTDTKNPDGTEDPVYPTTTNILDVSEGTISAEGDVTVNIADTSTLGIVSATNTTVNSLGDTSKKISIDTTQSSLNLSINEQSDLGGLHSNITYLNQLGGSGKHLNLDKDSTLEGSEKINLTINAASDLGDLTATTTILNQLGPFANKYDAEKDETTNKEARKLNLDTNKDAQDIKINAAAFLGDLTATTTVLNDLGPSANKYSNESEETTNKAARKLNLDTVNTSNNIKINKDAFLGELTASTTILKQLGDSSKKLSLNAASSVEATSGLDITINAASDLGDLDSSTTILKQLGDSSRKLKLNANTDVTVNISADSDLGALTSSSTDATSLNCGSLTVGSGTGSANCTSLNVKGSSTTYSISTGIFSISENTGTSKSVTGIKLSSNTHINGGLTVANNITANKVRNAVYNDLADAIEIDTKPEEGYCYIFDGAHYSKSSKYCQKGIIGIHSDTFGMIMGQKNKTYELNTAVAGFVLAYVDKVYPTGTPLTCTKDGKLTKIGIINKLLHPERIVGTFWKDEKEETWNDIPVKGRYWIKVK